MGVRLDGNSEFESSVCGTGTAYAYDLAGRRTGVGGSFARTGTPQAASPATYNVNNQLTQWKGASLTYDANGYLTSDGSFAFWMFLLEGSDTWNARNQLVSISGGASASFQYDPFGRRVSKTIGGTTHYLYDGANPVQEISGSSASANLLTGGVDEYFQRTDSAGARNFLTDALGSTLALADSTGAVQTQYTFEPFGNTSVTGAATTNSFAYTGRELDATGLYFYRARYYSSVLGRFVNEDPLGVGGGDADLYAYAGDDPVDFADPLGLYSWDQFLYDAAQVSAGAGDNLSFGLTSVVRNAMGTNSVVDKCGGGYKGGQWLGTGVGLAFGAAQLGRTALLQAGEGGLGQGLSRLAFDNRTWGAVRTTWSEAAGGGEPFLQDAGQSLHHWLLPQRWAQYGVPRGILNAGFNYIPISADINSWMNGTTLLKLSAEWGLKGVVAGIYGSIGRAPLGGRSCGCS